MDLHIVKKRRTFHSHPHWQWKFSEKNKTFDKLFDHILFVWQNSCFRISLYLNDYANLLISQILHCFKKIRVYKIMQSKEDVRKKLHTQKVNQIKQKNRNK